MNKIISDKIDKIKEICKKHNVKEMYVIGSVVSDNFTPDSDIDFLIKFNDISIKEYTDNYFELHQKLHQIFNRNIDLITYKSLRNLFFIQSINASKQLLYAS